MNVSNYVLQNKYEIIKELNSGGFGTVYLASDISNQIEVAIKIIKIPDNNYLNLMQRELEITTQLTHKNIIKTLYTEYDETTNSIYIVMDLAKQGSLSDFLKNQNSLLDLDTCLTMFLQILEGVNYAHSTIIHRDLKPNNILIDENNLYKVCDFGLSKHIEDSTKSFSFKGAGTYAYMSPECWLDEKNTIQMDIYSLGIMFFEILTLKKPFECKTPQEYRSAHLFDILPSIDNLRKDVPVKLKEILVKMCNKKTNQRYNNIAEIIKSISELQIDINTSDKSSEVLASLVHNISNEEQKRNSERKRKEEEEEEYKKLLNYSISELMEDIKLLIQSTNEKLIDNKITIQSKKNFQDLDEISLHFRMRSLKLSFFDMHYIKNLIKKDKENFIKKQQREYGFVIQNFQETVFEKENFLLVGLCVIQNGSEEYSHNIILKKDKKESIYGDWYSATFSDSSLIPYEKQRKNDYGLNISDFYNEYPKSRFMHIRSVKIEKITPNDITLWIKTMLL